MINITHWKVYPLWKMNKSIHRALLKFSENNTHSTSRVAKNPLWPLRWRHNEHDGVSNHQRFDCLLDRLFRPRSKKTSSSASLAFVRGIHRWPVNSPHKGPVTRKMFPFDDVMMANNKFGQHPESRVPGLFSMPNSIFGLVLFSCSLPEAIREIDGFATHMCATGEIEVVFKDAYLQDYANIG